MKLLRYGPQGAEKPGLLDAGRQDPRSLRPRRRHRRRDALRRGARPAAQARHLEAARGRPLRPPRPLRRRHRQVHLHRPQLFRPRRRDRRHRAARADHLHEGDERHLRPRRPGHHPARLREDRLGGRARLRHRQAREVRLRGRRPRPRGRLLPGQRRLRARLPDRAPGPVDQGQVLRPLRPDRPLARHPRRGRRPAEAPHVAEGERPDPPGRLHRHHGLRREVPRRLPQPVHEPRPRRHRLHRHPAGRRHGA